MKERFPSGSVPVTISLVVAWKRTTLPAGAVSPRDATILTRLCLQNADTIFAVDLGPDLDEQVRSMGPEKGVTCIVFR